MFGKDLAVDLMFQESQILVAVLLRLVEEAIPALPMHDGIMVPQSRKARASVIMREASGEFLGNAPLPVTEKLIKQPLPGTAQVFP
jgi:hypothetical protein